MIKDKYLHTKIKVIILVSLVGGIILSLIFVDGEFCFDSCSYFPIVPMILSPFFMIFTALIFSIWIFRFKFWKATMAAIFIVTILILQLTTSFGFHAYESGSTMRERGFENINEEYLENGDTLHEYKLFVCDGYYFSFRIYSNQGQTFRKDTECYYIKRICTETVVCHLLGQKEICSYEMSKCEEKRLDNYIES